MPKHLRHAVELVLILLVAAACADEGADALGPNMGEDGASPPASPTLSFHLHCAADMREGTLTCAEPAASGQAGGVPGAGALAVGPGAFSTSGELIVGGQGTLVRLESVNVCFEDACPGGKPGDEIFQADVTVQNLMGQALGAAGGGKPDGNGVRVFFFADPQVTHGEGKVLVENADGVATFTESGQPYFQYGGKVSPDALGSDDILETEEVSEPRTWQWAVSGEVEAFSFTVGVSAMVADTDALDKVLTRQGVIASGETHTCALAEDGAAYCWGSGGNGRLGDGGLATAHAPVAVDGGHTFTWLAAGNAHTCGVRDDGKAYCWGSQSSGRLGNGEDSGNATSPVPVSGELVFASVSAGTSFTCGLTPDGQAYCWGYNFFGQLGDGTRTDRDTPTPVDQGELVFTHLSTGGTHTCALSDAGAAYCWGANTIGQLGNGSVGGGVQQEPAPVTGGHTFRTLISGTDHTCGITTEGATYCWGRGGNGELGYGGDEAQGYPVEVIGGKPEFAAVGIGRGRHTCAVTLGGAAYCWGQDEFGRLGTEPGTDRKEPGLVVGGLSFSSIAPGGFHTCGIAADGDAYCWGHNTNSQLGIGVNGGEYPEPERVDAPMGVVWKTTP